MSKKEKIEKAINAGNNIKNKFPKGIVSSEFYIVYNYLSSLEKLFKKYKKYNSSGLELAINFHNFSSSNPLSDLGNALIALKKL